MKVCGNVKSTRMISVLRLKPDADTGLIKMPYEELELRGLVPQLSNYDVHSTNRLSDAEIGEIMFGRHEWVTGGAIQVSDLIRIGGDSDLRFYYRDTNGYVPLEFMFEIYQLELRDGELLIFVVPPESKPYPSALKGSMDAMQAIIGGTAGIDYFGDNAIIVTNKEAQSFDAPVNRIINGKVIIGTFFICGLDDRNEPCSLTEEQLAGLIVQFNLT